jgi:hypothetical protein
MAVALETARSEWEEGNRRVEAARSDRVRYQRLLAQVDVVLDELRRRIGQTFTLEALAEAYEDAERWSREAISERAPTAGWARDVATVQAAAFHAYQTGASDYEP